MRTSALLSCLVWLLSASAAPVPLEIKAPELIVNGSFEDGPEVSIHLPLDANSEVITGWVVTRGQIDYCDTHWKNAHGKRSLDLHGSPGFGGVKQTIKTEKGATYRVTFQMAGNPGVSSKKMTLGVWANKQTKTFAFDCTGKTIEDMGWTKKSWEFKADADETIIEIATTMTEDPLGGPALDNVSVKRLK